MPDPTTSAPLAPPGDPAPLPFSRVLVTGGAGFIGSALVWALNRRGIDRVVVVDRLGTGEKWRNLVPLAFEDYLEADDLLPRLGAGALGDFDCVLHMGACSATTERNATYLARNNFEFTKALAQWALPRGVRLVYASSAATYGDGAAGMDDRTPDAASCGRSSIPCAPSPYVAADDAYTKRTPRGRHHSASALVNSKLLRAR